MYRVLRIIFCILAVAAAAAVIFVFALVDWVWGLVSVAVAVLFGALMVLFKKLQTAKELKDNPPPPQGDFITGKIENCGEKDEK